MLTRLRFIVLVLFALTLSLTASAQRTTDPSALTLASMTPANAMFYVSARTDAGFIETLDGLIARITESSIGSAMNNTLGSLLDSEGVRSWLGDSAAIFMLPPTTEDQGDNFGILVEITDPAAAIVDITKDLGSDPVIQPNGNAKFFNGAIYITVTQNLVIGSSEEVFDALPSDRIRNLADSPRFQQAMMALPSGGDYPLFAYFDPEGAITTLGPDLFADFGEVDVPAFAKSIGVFAAGMRQLDAQTYTFDMSWSFGEGSPLAALNLPDVNLLPTPPAINLDFLSVVPADTQLVLQGAGLWSQLEAATHASATLINALRAQMMDSGMNASPSNGLLLGTGQWGNAFLVLMIRGSLDLTSEQLSAALDGDGVFALRLSLIPNERVPKLMIEPGAWFASRDDGSAGLLAGGRTLLKSFGVNSAEQADGIGFDLHPMLTGQNLTSDSPVILPPLMVWLATDTLSYIGADSLTLENKQTLVAVPRITERIEPIRRHLLENATGFAWIDVAALAPIINETDSSVQMATSPFDALFVSSRQTADDLTMRLAFTLK